MLGGNVIDQVREGMTVQSADGHTLGKIAQVWIGSDPAMGTGPCDEDICSRIEVRQRDGTLYIPANMIASVAGRSVTLTADQALVNEHDWYRAPSWIPADDPLHGLGRTSPFRT